MERSRKGEGRRRASVGAWLVAACVLAVSFTGWASPSSPGPLEAGPSAPSVTSGPRFAAGGPDAAEYGEADGYPIGLRLSFWNVRFLVGAQSHLDQVFTGRLVRRAKTPSRLERAVFEPPL